LTPPYARKTGILALVYGIEPMVRIDSRGTSIAPEGIRRVKQLCNGLELCFAFSVAENRGHSGAMCKSLQSIPSPDRS